MILGDKHIVGVEYKETFGLVAKKTSVHCFLSVAATQGWAFHEMDINNAFLHGDLDEEV